VFTYYRCGRRQHQLTRCRSLALRGTDLQTAITVFPRRDRAPPKHLSRMATHALRAHGDRSSNASTIAHAHARRNFVRSRRDSAVSAISWCKAFLSGDEYLTEKRMLTGRQLELGEPFANPKPPPARASNRSCGPSLWLKAFHSPYECANDNDRRRILTEGVRKPGRHERIIRFSTAPSVLRSR